MNQIKMKKNILVLLAASLLCSSVRGQITIADTTLPGNDLNLECYANAIEFISKDTQIRKGFLFLAGKKKLGKKYFDNRFYKLKINDRLYAPSFDIHGLACSDSMTMNKQVNSDEPALIKLVTNDKDYKFIVFFSKNIGNYFECKIVNASDPEMDTNYFARTRFGRVIILNFCIHNNRIVEYKMMLIQAN